MSVWDWIVVGVVSWFVLAVVAAFVFAAVLRRIGREVTALHDVLDKEAWATRPLTRETEDVDLGAEEDRARRRLPRIRSRR